MISQKTSGHRYVTTGQPGRAHCIVQGLVLKPSVLDSTPKLFDDQVRNLSLASYLLPSDYLCCHQEPLAVLLTRSLISEYRYLGLVDGVSANGQIFFGLCFDNERYECNSGKQLVPHNVHD